jgi:tricorn protease
MPKGYKVAYVYPDGPADKEWIKLAAGDYITAIEGTPIKPGDNYWQLLNSPLNDYVTLTVGGGATGAPESTIRIRSIASPANLKYEAWVAKNREMVDKATNGQIAYVHIRAMDQPSLVRFQNEVDQFWQKKGIIVDIRYNGGGNTDQQLIDILERRPYEYWNSRYGAPSWGRRPRQAIAGPKVMMINWRSASDSEVTPMAFKQLGLGRLVANPTSAAVIATARMRSSTARIDPHAGFTGRDLRPGAARTTSASTSKITAWRLTSGREHAEDELKGVDRELQAAIDEVMKMLKEGLWQYRASSRDRFLVWSPPQGPAHPCGVPCPVCRQSLRKLAAGIGDLR